VAAREGPDRGSRLAAHPGRDEALDHATRVDGTEGRVFRPDEQPDLVCVSVTLPQHAEAAVELLGALGTLEPRPVLAIGGQAWDGNTRIAKAIGADLAAHDPRELLAILAERLPPLPDEEG